MSIEILTSIIANGTTAFDWGYAPWLPFYNFFPALILGSLFVTLGVYCFGNLFSEVSATRAILAGCVTLTSGLSALAVVIALWVKLDLNPAEVFGWWSLNLILMFIGQVIYIRKDVRTREKIKEMEERDI